MSGEARKMERRGCLEDVFGRWSLRLISGMVVGGERKRGIKVAFACVASGPSGWLLSFTEMEKTG